MARGLHHLELMQLACLAEAVPETPEPLETLVILVVEHPEAKAARLMAYSTRLAVSFVDHIITESLLDLGQAALVVRVARDALEILAALRTL